MRAVNLFKIGRVSWLAAEKRAQEKDRSTGLGGAGVLMRTGYFWGEWKVLEGTEVVVVEHCLCAEGP